MKTIQTIFMLPEDLKRQLKVKAAQDGRTMSEIAVELIQKYLLKNKGK